MIYFKAVTENSYYSSKSEGQSLRGGGGEGDEKLEILDII